MSLRQVPWAIALVCVVLGFMLSMQFKVQKQVALKDITGFQRAEELARQLEKAEQDRDGLAAEVGDLRERIRTLGDSQTEFRTLAGQLEQAQLFAGLTPAEGPGVTVTMNDSTRPATPGENPNNFILHDEDLLRVINELYAAGAEAIAVNNQRLVGKSEIRCAGPTITINGVRTAPPVVIAAIGEPAVLDAAITMRGGIAEGLKQWGIQVAVKRESTLIVPAYKGALKLQYAERAKLEVSR